MAFKFQKISGTGAGHPVVARTSFQAIELLKSFDLTETKREQVLRILLFDVQPKLVTCWDIKEALLREVGDHRDKIMADAKTALNVQRNSYSLPSVLDLQQRVETFLYNAKSTLRDFYGVFAELLGAPVARNAVKFSDILKWARQTYGEKDSLTVFLKNDEPWITRIVTLRNAIEHPGGYSGTLHVHNFSDSLEGSEIVIDEPQWNVDSEAKTSIANDMDVLAINLLTFCEEALVLALLKCKQTLPMVIIEIPEAKRNAQCPVRFHAVPDMRKLPPLPRS